MISEKKLTLIEDKLSNLAINRDLEKFNRQMTAIANNCNLNVSSKERELALNLKQLFKARKVRAMVKNNDYGR